MTISATRSRRPALFRRLHDRFLNAVDEFIVRHDIPKVEFEAGQDKDAIVAGYRARVRAREGVVIVGVAPEKMRPFKAHKRLGLATAVTFDFSRQSVAVNHFYFCVQDRDWGPALLKIGTYVPYPVNLCLNGHEWVKQRLRRDRLRFESLDNGFLSCRDAAALQAACDTLGPADVQAFFDRWSHRLPWPMTPTDRAAGYDHRVAICQLEMSLTQVFDRPVQGRHFFEAAIRENLDLGRPDPVGLLFPLRITRTTPPTPYGYRTRVITDGVQPSLHVEYKHSHVKQYFKEQHALRTETTINNPKDFYINKGSRTCHISESSAIKSIASSLKSSASVSSVCLPKMRSTAFSGPPSKPVNGPPRCASATPVSWPSCKPSPALSISPEDFATAISDPRSKHYSDSPTMPRA
jgi:hypothetical protein